MDHFAGLDVSVKETQTIMRTIAIAKIAGPSTLLRRVLSFMALIAMT
jgi:hypothetical protein